MFMWGFSLLPLELDCHIMRKWKSSLKDEIFEKLKIINKNIHFDSKFKFPHQQRTISEKKRLRLKREGIPSEEKKKKMAQFTEALLKRLVRNRSTDFLIRSENINVIFGDTWVPQMRLLKNTLSYYYNLEPSESIFLPPSSSSPSRYLKTCGEKTCSKGTSWISFTLSPWINILSHLCGLGYTVSKDEKIFTRIYYADKCATTIRILVKN